MAQLTPLLDITGLWIDPNPLTKTPNGAMLQADEVVIRRKGTAEPRPGFQSAANGASFDGVAGMIPYDGKILAVSGDDAYTAWEPSTAVLTESATTPSWDWDAIRGQEARKNLYVSTEDILRKLTSGTSAQIYRAGLQTLALYGYSIAGAVVADQRYVAYRVLLRRTDVNGVIVRGAPSGRFIYRHTTGGTVALSLRAWFNPLVYAAAGDVVELYRSTQKTVIPPDVLYLAQEQTLDSADISAGYVDFTDTRLDADLGRALYTNPAREGIERANTMPPKCRDVQLYQGSLFCAGVTYPHKLQLQFDEAGSCTGVATGIGTRAATGDLTNGSPTILNVASLTGVKIGMLVAFGPSTWAGTGPVRITGISGTTVTVNQNWTGLTLAAQAITFIDSIKIQGEYFPAGSAANLVARIAGHLGGAFTWLFNVRSIASAQVTAMALGDASLLKDSVATYGNVRRVLLERFTPVGTAFEVWATHGSEYTPPLAEPEESPANGVSSTRDDFQNGIAWSKKEQPEHFMLGANLLIGAQRSKLLRIFAAGDALWLLKGKGDGGGIHRLSGASERTGWSSTQRDANTYLLHPSLACKLGDKVYAWTNRGAVEISDAGIAELSAPVIGSLFRYLEQNLDDTNTYPGAFCVANEKADEVIWGLPDLANEGNWVNDGALVTARVVYVLNTRTRAWSRWFADIDTNENHQFAAACYDAATRRLVFGRNDGTTLRKERLLGSTVEQADEQYTVTINTVSVNTVTIAAGSGWTPAVGDLVNKGGWAVVTAITSATVFTVHNGTTISAGSSTSYVAYESALKWLAKVGEGPAVAKRYTDIMQHWEASNGVQRYSVTAEASQNAGTTQTLPYDLTYAHDFDPDVMMETRALLPRNVAMTPRIYPGLKVKVADARWRLSGITLNHQPASIRVAR